MNKKQNGNSYCRVGCFVFKWMPMRRRMMITLDIVLPLLLHYRPNVT